MKKDTMPLFMTALMLMAFSIILSPLVDAKGESITLTQGEEQLIAEPATLDNKSPQSVVSVEYMLPYPGILNDHPLYFLKKFRDQVLDFLIADPVKKAEFYILQSDKFLSMAMMHESQSKWDITVGTAKLSVENIDKAVNKIKQVKSGGVTPPAALVDKLFMSKAKHTEIFQKMRENTQEQNIKTEFDTLLTNLENSTAGLISGE